MEAYSLVGKDSSDFYIVDSAYSWAIERLTRTANVKEGAGLTRDEKLRHAMYFVEKQGMPIEAAAKMMAISAGTLHNALSAAEVEERLKNLGFHERLYPSALEELHRIKQDSALVESAKLVHEAQLSARSVAEVARKVSNGRSEKEQQVIIANLRRQFRSQIVRTRSGQIRQQILPTDKFRRAVDAINSTRPESVRPLEKDLVRKTRSALKKLEEVLRDESGRE
jgi:predicted Zn-dependent protease